MGAKLGQSKPNQEEIIEALKNFPYGAKVDQLASILDMAREELTARLTIMAHAGITKEPTRGFWILREPSVK